MNDVMEPPKKEKVGTDQTSKNSDEKVRLNIVESMLKERSLTHGSSTLTLSFDDGKTITLVEADKYDGPPPSLWQDIIYGIRKLLRIGAL